MDVGVEGAVGGRGGGGVGGGGFDQRGTIQEAILLWSR